MTDVYLSQCLWGDDWGRAVSYVEEFSASGIVLHSKDVFSGFASGFTEEQFRERVAFFVGYGDVLKYWALEEEMDWRGILSSGFRGEAEALSILASSLGIERVCLRGGFSPSPSHFMRVLEELDYFSWFLSTMGMKLVLVPQFPREGGIPVGVSCFSRVMRELGEGAEYWVYGEEMGLYPLGYFSKASAVEVFLPLPGVDGEFWGKVFSNQVPFVFRVR